MEWVAINFDVGHLRIRYDQSLWVICGVEFGLHCQATARFGVGNQVDNDFVAYQRTATPVHGDEREQTMFDLVPLARSWWKVVNPNVHSNFFGQSTEFEFP